MTQRVSDEWMDFLFVLALPGLTMTERQALYLRLFKKMKHSDINETLGISSSKVMLSRVKRKVLEQA